MRNLAMLFLLLMLVFSCTKDKAQKVDFEELYGFSQCFNINGFYVIKDQNQYNQLIENARDDFPGCDTRVPPNEDFENRMLLITHTLEPTAVSFKKSVKYDIEKNILRYKLVVEIPSGPVYSDAASIMHVISVPKFAEDTSVEFEFEKK